ncbi:hypothetical protein [Claveliimonas bilis]|nr:hypothetical protein [Claveliimonas bilis]
MADLRKTESKKFGEELRKLMELSGLKERAGRFYQLRHYIHQ